MVSALRYAYTAFRRFSTRFLDYGYPAQLQKKPAKEAIMRKLSRSAVISTGTVIGLFTWGIGLALAGSQQPSDGQKLSNAAEHSNMQLVGTNDLQSRSTYQPTVHKYPNGRYILFAGHHPLNSPGEGQLPGTLPSFNSLTGKNEPNGTSIVDVTDPAHPQYLFHIPVGAPV